MIKKLTPSGLGFVEENDLEQYCSEILNSNITLPNGMDDFNKQIINNLYDQNQLIMSCIADYATSAPQKIIKSVFDKRDEFVVNTETADYDNIAYKIFLSAANVHELLFRKSEELRVDFPCLEEKVYKKILNEIMESMSESPILVEERDAVFPNYSSAAQNVLIKENNLLWEYCEQSAKVMLKGASEELIQAATMTYILLDRQAMNDNSGFYVPFINPF